MFNEHIYRCFLTTILAAVVAVSAEPPAEQSYMDYPEWGLLPAGVDLDDENEVQAFQRLIGRGESTHEAMLAIVRECDDPFMVSHALEVLRESSGNKCKVVAELRRIFLDKLQYDGQRDEIVISDMAEAIADIGDEDDMEALIPMLAHPVKRVQGLGGMLLVEHGGQKTLDALEQAKRESSSSQVCQEIDDVIAGIESRLAEQDAEAAPSP